MWGVEWRAITEPGHLEAWFPPRIIGEWTAGAPLTFEARGGEHPALYGEELACDPPSRLEFRCGTDVRRFQIKPLAGDGPGCTFARPTPSTSSPRPPATAPDPTRLDDFA